MDLSDIIQQFRGCFDVKTLSCTKMAKCARIEISSKINGIILGGYGTFLYLCNRFALIRTIPNFIDMTVTTRIPISVSDFGTARRCGQALSAAIQPRMTQGNGSATGANHYTVIIGDRGSSPLAERFSPAKVSPANSFKLFTLNLRNDVQRNSLPYTSAL